MAILPDTFSGFSLNFQQGKLTASRVLKGVSDDRLPGKLASSRVVREVPYSISVNKIETFIPLNWNLVPIPENRIVGKLAVISPLKGVQDIITVSKINTLPSYQVADNFNVPIQIFGKLQTAHAARGIISDSNLKTYSKLSYFSPTSNPSDYSIEVTGQSLDLTTDVYTVNSIFTENNPSSSYLWTKSSAVSTSTKTLYFANQRKIIFEIGETVRIRNDNAGYNELVTVIASTSSSITYNSNNLIPEISGTFIDSGSTLYQTRYFNALDATNSIQRYAFSVIAPGLKGVSYPYQSIDGFNDNVIKQTSKLSFYAPSDNPSDYTIEITGESLDSESIVYSSNTIFIENNPTSGYLWNKTTITPTGSKTLFFAPQNPMKFFAGDVVRLRNVASGYSELITITSANSNSITYSSNNLIPEAAGSFIDSGSTLYRRLYYTESTATNNFKNYITSIIAPGLRGAAYQYQSASGFVDRLSSVSKINSSYNFGNQTTNYIDNLGQINKFKTGDFKRGSNGIQDPATIKKAPIQFWS